MQNARNQSASTWRMLVSGVFFVLIFVVGMPVWGQNTAAIIDSIDDINGDKISIKYKGKYTKTNLYPGRELEDGDVITAQPNSSITLTLNGKTETVNSSNSPYTVKYNVHGAECGGWWSSFICWFNGLVEKSGEIRFTTTRSGNSECQEPISKLKEFSIPMLKEVNAKLLHGKRSKLYVGWYGGSSPYTVQVYIYKHGKYEEVTELAKRNITITKPTQCHQLMIKEVEIDSASWEFKQGERYQIRISSPSEPKQPAIGTFMVVPDSEDPLTAKKRRKSFHLQASHLAFEGNGEWKFEAYQKVGDGKNESARIVRWGLSRGELPRAELPRAE